MNINSNLQCDYTWKLGNWEVNKVKWGCKSGAAIERVIAFIIRQGEGETSFHSLMMPCMNRPFLFWHSHLLHFQLCTPLQAHLVLHFLRQGKSSGISKSLSTLCPLSSLPCKGTVVTKQPSLHKPRKEPLPKTEPCYTLIWNFPASLNMLVFRNKISQ